MEEKNRNHGPTEEELSDSVKEAYTSVYELDPMAEDFDEGDLSTPPSAPVEMTCGAQED